MDALVVVVVVVLVVVVGRRRGGQSRDAVSVRLHVDLDIVRMLDVLHESPG